jgi:hypothetical protein
VLVHLHDDALVVADLTDANPNVYYELAVRHSFRQPVVLLIDHEQKPLFDIQSLRSITYATDSWDSLAKAIEALSAAARRECECAEPYSPVFDAVRREAAIDTAGIKSPELGDLLREFRGMREELRTVNHRIQSDDRRSRVTNRHLSGDSIPEEVVAKLEFDAEIHGVEAGIKDLLAQADERGSPPDWYKHIADELRARVVRAEKRLAAKGVPDELLWDAHRRAYQHLRELDAVLARRAFTTDDGAIENEQSTRQSTDSTPADAEPPTE